MKIFLFSLLILISTNTYASCGGQFDPTTGTCRFIDSSGREILYNSAPPQAGKRVQSTTQNIIIQLPSKYGSMAQSKKTGGVATAMNRNSKAEAVKVALKRCENIKGNGKCRTIATITNGCHSLAMGRKGRSYKMYHAAGTNGSRHESEEAALNKCRKAGEKDCEILIPEECSLPEIPR